MDNQTPPANEDGRPTGLSVSTGSVPYDENSIEHNETGETPLYHIGIEEWEDRHICDRCGGEGFIEYNDGDGGDWGEDSPSEENHLITCRQCNGTGAIK